MTSVNQTWPRCVNQIGKRQSKLLVARSFKTFAVFRMQSVFFWEFPWRLKFKSKVTLRLKQGTWTD